MALPDSIRDTLRRQIAIDLRALAALRIGLASILFFDLLCRAPDIASLYSDFGVLPRSAADRFSLYGLSGSPAFVGLLFAVSGLVALMLLVGYHTWVATALSWLLFVSLLARNPAVDNSGDHLLSLLLFWGLFLPLGARASLDAGTSRTEAPLPRVVVCAAGLGLMLQVVYPYVFSALAKDYGIWVTEGLAIYNALNLDCLARPAGRALLAHPVLVRWASPLTYWVEMFGPLLAFVPFATAWLRTIAVLIFIAFHVGLEIAFELGVFPAVCIVMWVALLPEPAWDFLAGIGPLARLARAGGRWLDAVAHGLADAVQRQPWLAPPPDDGRATLPGNVLAGIVTVYLFAWNVGTVYPAAKMPQALSWPGEQLYIGQQWVMFQTPPIDDGWWIVPAVLSDGREVNLFAGGSPVSWEKPRSVLATSEGARWQHFFNSIWLYEEHRAKAVGYAAWLRRGWNGSHPPAEQVDSMRLVYVAELTRPDYRPPLISRQTVYSWSRGGEEQLATRAQSLRAIGGELETVDPQVVADIARSLGSKAPP